MNSWHSYPSIYNLGHRSVKDLLTVPVNVEEKVDGSQFSWGKTEEGELLIRSKGQKMVLDAPEKMFNRAVETVKSLSDKLTPGWTYRAEYLNKPKHNTLAYDRVPNGFLVVFDINRGEEEYTSYEEKKAEAERLGLETAPLLFQGNLDNIDSLKILFETTSFLGGQKIEGVVVKQQNPVLFGQDKKALIGKFVSEAFKEVHQGEWKKSNPTSGDLVMEIGTRLKTPARWHKAVQHLKEAGKIEDSPKDIGALMKEVPADIKKECEAEIRDLLFSHYWPKIARFVAAGLPEWYKEELLKKQFSVGE